MSDSTALNRRTFLGSMAAGLPAGLWINLAHPPEAAAATTQQLAEGFAKPPDSARPWVYWFWVNGNVTKEGITADLEAMHRVGIGGVLIMEVDGQPIGPVAFAGVEWREMFRFACQEASRLGLEVNMNDAAGWTGSAGPWITPEMSMQKVVWSEVTVTGGRRFDEALPAPTLAKPHSPPGAEWDSGPALGSDYYRDVAVIAFPTPANASYRISDIEYKAGFETRSTPPGSPRGIPLLPVTYDTLPAASTIDRAQIKDLTAQFQNGRLAWDVPPGNWTVLRVGHASTAKTNHPSPPAGRGLECDKMSKAAIELHFEKFIGSLVKLVGPLAGKTLVSTHVDSWEVGGQNWTARFPEEFRHRCGYDILPFLPVMTGRVVGDLEVSERFLWDLRKTISDVIADNYAARLGELAKQSGLRLSMEALDGDPCDEIALAGQAHEPQTEFWYTSAGHPVGQMGDFTRDTFRSYSWTSNMVSAAHTYGRRIMASEAFTALPGENWLAHPATMKPLGDWAFCQGINRFIFHRYAMQPWLDRKPGMTMAFWGVHYERTQTWWEESGPWHEYLTRCQFMLRQGLFVADLLYLQPEGAPTRFMPPGVDMKNPVPPDPPGYNFDGCTADVLLKRVSIKEGRIVLPDGMSYRLLVLPAPGEQVLAGVMTPQLLKRIEQLVNEGMVVVGPPPLKSPSLRNYPACDTELKAIAQRLWGEASAPVDDRRVGKGRVVWGQTPQQVLAAMNVPVDFSCGTPAPFRYIHRRAEDGTEIYFVASKQSGPAEAACSFRVAGRRPEFWWPESGRVERPATYEEQNGITRMPVRLPEFGSVFVVFRPDNAPEPKRATAITLPQTLTVPGPWDVHFAPHWGAPERVQFPDLISWTEHTDPGVRYFSGKATYANQLRIPSAMLAKGHSLHLDLGEVQVIARVKLNGRELGILWKPPFRIDITGAARAGKNLLEVTVVNLWPNRLIGDANLPEDCEWVATPFPGSPPLQALKRWPQWLLDGKPSPTGRFTFAIIKVWPKDAPLLKSGLIGPVTLLAEANLA